MRNDFTGVILTHVDTFQTIRKIIKQPIIINAPVGPPPIISELNHTNRGGGARRIRTTNPIKT